MQGSALHPLGDSHLPINQVRPAGGPHREEYPHMVLVLKVDLASIAFLAALTAHILAR
jgi:hypothetical protein